MIVPPRLLTECLDNVDQAEQRQLALVFARHPIDLFEQAERPDVIAELRAALDCATRALGDEADIEELGPRARQLLYVQPVTEGLAELVSVAIDAALQRELEDAGHFKRNRNHPTVQDIAQMAQALRGKMAGPDPVDGRRARWEEARWQLVQVIERAPFPEPPQGDG